METEIKKILVVDDHEEIRELVQRFLNMHNFNTFVAEDSKSMRAIMEKEQIDLLVLDIMLPGDDGLSICKKLREEKNNIPIIMLTAMTEDTDKIVGLEIGADDYLTKPFNSRELLARIKALLRRTTTVGESKPIKLSKYFFCTGTLDITKRELSSQKGEIITLSTAEYDLLITFLQNPQKTLSRDFLLDIARGREAQIFDRSIDTLVSRLRKKLKSVNEEECIKTVWGGGYCFTAEVTNDTIS